jgi:hypothetical protein
MGDLAIFAYHERPDGFEASGIVRGRRLGVELSFPASPRLPRNENAAGHRVPRPPSSKFIAMKSCPNPGKQSQDHAAPAVSRNAWFQSRNQDLVAARQQRSSGHWKIAFDQIQHGRGDNEIPGAAGSEIRNLTPKGALGGCGSMISIGAKLGELLVYPMPSITTAPDLSIDKSACDRSTRNEDRPQVPCLGPGWPRAHVHHHRVIVAVSNHERLSKKQSRRAEYNRPTASPC